MLEFWSKVIQLVGSEISKFKHDKNISTLGMKYPSFRDDPYHMGETWLDGKRADDGADGLWRIHDGLYDLSEFVEKHPGGSEWLKFTKGTDITEAFEVHHISNIPQQMLSKFYVQQAKSARNSPFTFHEQGFYKTLKGKVRKELKTVPEAPAKRSKLLTDLLVASYVCLSILSVHVWSLTLGVIAGVTLALGAMAAHNFFHQKNNFRMYYFDLTMMSSREWRVSHVLSHHLYPNTINDMEISMFEPFAYYLPIRKPFLVRYMSWIYSPVIYFIVFWERQITGMVYKIPRNLVRIEDLLPFTILLPMYVFSGERFAYCFGMFCWNMSWASFYFTMVGVNAAHHHPDIFHDGDNPRPQEELDFGVYQLDAVGDKTAVKGSHFLVLTNFGDHALHHLFPTVDHGKLEYLYPVFLDTCKEFGLEWREISQIEMVKGQFRQLAKNTPNPVPPKPIKQRL